MPIAQLGNKHGIKFTFFVNPGRSISRGLMLEKLLPRRKERQLIDAALQLPARSKLGWKDYFYAAIVNPKLSSYSDHIRYIAESNHEIGLHGGRNHQVWADTAMSWNKNRITEEISWGIEKILKIAPESMIQGFASPGWTHPEKLNDVLDEMGFTYVADAHGGKALKNDSPLKSIQTHLTGEPGGVAWFEHLAAKGYTDEQMVEKTVSTVLESDGPVVLYDHPYYVGVSQLEVLGAVIERLKSEGVEFLSMRELSAR
jgi:peptidoglycan/xylan/chitin deacetylase (PgdA/CDA1 family)